VLGVHELRLNPDAAVCDVQLFDADLRAGRLEAAAARYVGPFLDGFRLPGTSDFERWADEERTELGHRYAGALERLARAAAGRDDPADAARWWRRRAALDPLDARTAEALMRALVANGDTAGALQHARIYEVLVAQELDVPADGSILELARRIRAGEVAPPERPTAPMAAPVVAPVAAPGAAPVAAPAAPAVADAGSPAAEAGADLAATPATPATPALTIGRGDAPAPCRLHPDGGAGDRRRGGAPLRQPHRRRRQRPPL
jgi:hypothetical protein